MTTKASCSNCGMELTEMEDTRPANRQPCPKCGSTARSFSVTVKVSHGADLVVSPATVDTISGTGAVTALNATVTGAEFPYPVAEQLAHLSQVNEHVFTLVCTEPTEPGAQYTFTAFNEGGKLIGFGQGDDFEDAYLDVGDQLDPNKQGG